MNNKKIYKQVGLIGKETHKDGRKADRYKIFYTTEKPVKVTKK